MSIIDTSIKYSFLAEFHIIISDFHNILNFIEPSNENLETFSHRIFELLLRTATSFEAVSKRILINDGYETTPKKMNMKDYFTLNKVYKLTEYTLIIDSWRSGAKLLQPYKQWQNDTYSRLSWYTAYNNSKHDRHQNFKEANLENLLNAIGGLFILLYSQFGSDTFNNYQENTDFDIDDRGFISYPNFFFAIKTPLE